VTYEALADGVTPDRLLDEVMDHVAMPQIELSRTESAFRPPAPELP
jgi:hypothetical protein